MNQMKKTNIMYKRVIWDLWILIQWKLLNVISLGPRETDNIKQIIIIGHFCTVNYYNLVNGTFETWSQKAAANINRDHIKRPPL